MIVTTALQVAPAAEGAAQHAATRTATATRIPNEESKEQSATHPCPAPTAFACSSASCCVSWRAAGQRMRRAHHRTRELTSGPRPRRRLSCNSPTPVLQRFRSCLERMHELLRRDLSLRTVGRHVGGDNVRAQPREVQGPRPAEVPAGPCDDEGLPCVTLRCRWQWRRLLRALAVVLCRRPREASNEPTGARHGGGSCGALIAQQAQKSRSVHAYHWSMSSKESERRRATRGANLQAQEIWTWP